MNMRTIRRWLRPWIVRAERRRLHAADPKLAALYAELQRRKRDHRSTRPVMLAMREATTARLRLELFPAHSKAAERGASR